MEPELNLKGKEKNSSSNKNQTPEEFLLKKETLLGKTITPRFREYFYRELKRVSNRALEDVWEAVNGNTRA